MIAGVLLLPYVLKEKAQYLYIILEVIFLDVIFFSASAFLCEITGIQTTQSSLKWYPSMSIGC